MQERILPIVNQVNQRIIWTGLVFIIYIIFVVMAWSILGTSIITFYAVPVVISAWLWGTRTGLLVALLNWPFNKLLIGLVSTSNPNILFTPGGATGLIIALFLGLVVGRLHDLSKRLREEIKHHQADIETLAERERFIDKVLGATPGIIYVFDVSEQRNVYTNRQIADYLGFSSEQIAAMGSNLLPQLAHPNDMARLGALLSDWDSIADGDIIETTYRMKNAAGEWRWFRGSYRLFTPE